MANHWYSPVHTEMLDFAMKVGSKWIRDDWHRFASMQNKLSTESSAEMPETKDRVTLGLRHPPIRSFTLAAPPQ